MINACLFVLTSIFWGFSFVAIKWVIQAVPPITGAGLRVLVSFSVLTCAYQLAGISVRLPLREKLVAWLGGLFSTGLPFALLFWGEQNISPGLAGIINGTVPIWAFLIGLVVLKKTDPFSVSKLSGVLVGLAGIYAIFLPKLSWSGSTQELYGAVAVLLMAISYGVGAVINRYLFTHSKQVTVYSNVYHQHVSAFGFLWALALLREGSHLSLELFMNWRLWGAVSYLGICSTALAYLFYFRLIREWGAVRATTITYIVPFTAVTLDFLVFRNKPFPSEILGCGLILAAVLMMNASGILKKS